MLFAGLIGPRDEPRGKNEALMISKRVAGRRDERVLAGTGRPGNKDKHARTFHFFSHLAAPVPVIRSANYAPSAEPPAIEGQVLFFKPPVHLCTTHRAREARRP